jgi:hypothetical protein
MGDTSIADDIMEGVADALGDLGTTRTFQIITVPTTDANNPGAKPVESVEDVSVDALLFSFNEEYMSNVSIVDGNLMSILSIQDFTDAQVAAIKPGNSLLDTDDTTVYEIIKSESIEVAGKIVTVIVQLKG